MKKLKLLILYAGIGGNRKELNETFDITAVELDANIASVYSDLYPNDNVIVSDAMEYLLENFKRFDIIWASPECPTHSDIRRVGVHGGLYPPVFPNMDLYQIIIFLTHFYQGKWIVENVKPYYKYLIPPRVILGRHPFWANFDIPVVRFEDNRTHNKITGTSTVYGINLKCRSNIKDKRKVLRNMVNPQIGKYLIELASNSLLSKRCVISKNYTPSLFERVN